MGNHLNKENAVVRSQQHMQMDLFEARRIQPELPTEQKPEILQLIMEMLREALNVSTLKQQKGSTQALEASNEQDHV
jgi:hypothetical protein